jgi:hypothetical protein
MTQPTNEPSTYPDSWDDLPGTRTQKPGKEHANAREQEYYLQDESAPVKKGKHTRDDLNAPTKSTPGLFPAN